MNILKTYIDNVFASLPKNKEVNKMKEDLLLNMEEKYHELKQSGKTENEAVGIVISEFGNIEELAQELGVNIESNDDSSTLVDLEDAKSFIDTNKKMGRLISLGVFLCILGAAILVFLSSNLSNGLFSETNTIIGIVALIVLVAIGVGLFIYSGINLEKYNYLKEDIEVPNSVKEYIKIEQKNNEPKFVINLIFSVTLFILSPIAIIVFSILNNELNTDKYNLNLGVSILLILVAIGCFIIIKAGIVREGYNVLLQTGEYSKKKKKSLKKSEKVIEAVAGIYWPLIVVGYLLWSFIGRAWGISWIIWPIAGVLFGGIAGIVNALNSDKE